MHNKILNVLYIYRNNTFYIRQCLLSPLEHDGHFCFQESIYLDVKMHQQYLHNQFTLHLSE